MEIERKFLVKELPFLARYENFEIIQGYISLDPVIRIREMGDNYMLTVKSKGHMVREEFELPIDLKQYTSLFSKLEYPPIKKTRYFIPLENNLTAELDVFKEHLQGLVTVEVEFKSTKEASCFSAPSWFDTEVTHDSHYKNNHLACYGLPHQIKEQI